MKYSKDQIKWAKNEMLNKSRSKRESFRVIAARFGLNEAAVRSAYYFDSGWLYAGEGHKRIINVSEPKICMSIIRKHPDNLKHAFRLAAKKTNQSANIISNSYYLKGGNLNEIKNKKTIFRIIGFFNIFKKNMKNNIAKGKTSL